MEVQPHGSYSVAGATDARCVFEESGKARLIEKDDAEPLQKESWLVSGIAHVDGNGTYRLHASSWTAGPCRP